MPAPSAPPADGPCTPAQVGGYTVAPLAGRIERLRVAAHETTLRLVAELASPRRVLAVDLGDDGQVQRSAPIDGVSRATQVTAAPVTTPTGLVDVTWSGRRGASDSPDFAAANRYLAGAARTEVQMLAVDGLVAASDTTRWVGAAVAESLACFEAACVADDRASLGMRYHPRSGYSVRLVVPSAQALLVRSLQEVLCDDPSLGDEHGPGTLLGEDEPGTPPERCRRVRADRPSDPAVALRGPWVVTAWRTPRSVRVAAQRWEADLPAVATVHNVVENADVGAPAVALHNDVAWVVWPQRSQVSEPYTLRALSWRLSEASPPAESTALATGTDSAFAPSLAVSGGRLVLAWMEGDDRTARVRVGASREGLGQAVAHAVTVSGEGLNARNPLVATTATQAWVAWREYPGGRQARQGGGVVRATPLRWPGT